MPKLRIESEYGVAPNQLLNDNRLSWKAKGMWTYLQSKPDGWNFSKDRIKNDSADGRDGTMTGLQELEEYGYLKRKRVRGDRGYWSYEYVLSVNPHTENPCTDNPVTENPRTENPTEENPTSDYPTSENPTTNKERDSKQEIVNKKETGEGVDITHEHIVSIIDAFREWNPAAKKWYKNTTQREATERLIEDHGLERVKQVVGILNRTNRMQYVPTITTPLQLENKWVQLESAMSRKKQEAEDNKTKVI